jgi:succinate dehydrogenase/fumarate reductase flavoprotein subunit
MTVRNNTEGQLLEWPYELKYGTINRVELDVLVVGGGLAGTAAGIAAARRGARVGVADKAPIERSGCGGAGMDHYNNVLDYEGAPMTPEANIEAGMQQGRQIPRDYIALKGTWEALMELEKLGLPIRDVDDDFKGTATRDEASKLCKAYDYREMVAVKLRGGQYIKPVLYEGLRKAGAQLFERVMITSLLTEGGKQGAPVVGATGFSMETGEFYVFHAKSVIISSGYACTIWTYNLDITGNSYRWDPNDIGEGLAMVYRAGGQIVGAHKAGHTKAATPFAWPRFGVGNPSNTWFPCTIVDNNGKEVPWADADGKILDTQIARNMPAASQTYCGSTISDNYKKAATPNLVHDLPDRIRNGEFELPLWADLPSMTEEERRSIWGIMIGNEGKTRFTIFDYFTREGFDPNKDMLMAPIMEPDGYLSGGWFQGEPNVAKSWRSESFGQQPEIGVDWNLMNALPGLFSAGASSGLEGCSYAVSSGFYAGNRAAEYARTEPAAPVDEAQLQAEIERVYAPLRRANDPKAYVSWKELWGGSARVMQQCCGNYRTPTILRQGLQWMESIKENECNLTYARNPHEMARVMEDHTRITIGELLLNGVLEQMEHGKDVPRGTYVYYQLKDGVFTTELKPDKFWLAAPYEDSYLGNYNKIRAGERAEQAEKKEVV